MSNTQVGGRAPLWSKAAEQSRLASLMAEVNLLARLPVEPVPQQAYGSPYNTSLSPTDRVAMRGGNVGGPMRDSPTDRGHFAVPYSRPSPKMGGAARGAETIDAAATLLSLSPGSSASACVDLLTTPALLSIAKDRISRDRQAAGWTSNGVPPGVPPQTKGASPQGGHRRSSQKMWVGLPPPGGNRASSLGPTSGASTPSTVADVRSPAASVASVGSDSAHPPQIAAGWTH